MFIYPFRLPFSHPFHVGFSLPGFGELPPAINDLLVWLKGNDNDDLLKLDARIAPYRENFKLKGSHCIYPNGVDESGTPSKGIVLKPALPTIFECEFSSIKDQTVVDTLPTAGSGIGNYINFRSTGRCFVRFGDETVNEIFWSVDGFLNYEAGVPYVFSLTVQENGDFELLQNGSVWVSGNTQYVPDGVSQVDCEFGKTLSSNFFGGKLWNTTISDTHFRIAEGPGDGTNLISYSDNYETDGLYITWAGSPATMWGQRQDTYHGNSVSGWWDADSNIKYPYDPAGDYLTTLLTSADIVDVSRYDTTNDSDGGAWIGDLPAVMGIVVEPTKISVFDLTNPLGSLIAEYVDVGITSVFALNGQIIWGTATGLRGKKLITDTDIEYTTLTAPAIISDVVNSVAMTVIDDAPIDSETLIAVPTIAVATDGGVSVIDGHAGVETVVNLTGGTPSLIVSIGVDGRMSIQDGIERYLSYGWLANALADGAISTWRDMYYDNGTIPALVSRSIKSNVYGFVGHFAGGLTRLYEDKDTLANGMVDYTTNSYFSGIMQGDIQLALSGENLVDKCVKGIAVTDNGVATFTEVATGTDIKYTTAVDGTITATVPTGGICYGWELVSGEWLFRSNISEWAGVSESGGTLTVADGTSFTLLAYTSGTPSAAQLTEIETLEANLFSEGILCFLQGTSTDVKSLSYEESTDMLYAGTTDGITKFNGLVASVEDSGINTVAISYSGDENVVGTTTNAYTGYIIETTKHKGGTFNDSESSMGPKEFPVGTANGTDNTITMLADHGAIVSHGTLDTSTPNYTYPTITPTAGILRDILFEDGTFMQLREGTGTDLFDQNGILVGTLAGDPAFWAGAHMVSEEMILAEAVQGQNVFTDGFGHAVYSTQAEWEASLIINNNEQFYLTNCNGLPNLLIYSRVLTAAEDEKVLVFGCLAEAVQFDSQDLTFDGETTVMRI